MRALLALAAAALVGCAGGPVLTPEGRVPTFQDAGTMPSTPDEAKLRFILRELRLKDPDSAKTDGLVGPAFVVVPNEYGWRGGYGWAFCFDVNAKNSYGAYVGYRQNILVVREPSYIFHDQEDPEHGAIRSRAIRALCERVKLG